MAKHLVGGVVLSALLGATGCTMSEEQEDPPVGVSLQQLSTTDEIENGKPFANASGYSATISTEGNIELKNEFFQDLGTNGRRCVSCHLPGSGWTITPADMQQAFADTDGGVIDDEFGLGAVFRLNDGATRPDADVSTLEKRRAAYSMLLTKGLIRVSMPVPESAEFELIAVDDPYGYSSAADLSMFRRPLPSTNLKFLTAVMWDGRETLSPDNIHLDLSNQSSGATEGHAEGLPLSAEQRASIVRFEVSLHTAQIYDNKARYTDDKGARGGPEPIIAQEFYFGINDNFGDLQTGAPFTENVFDIYDAWKKGSATRQAVKRGQDLFNRRKFTLSGVGGLNSATIRGVTLPASFEGTCTTCHNTPNAGNHSIIVPLDIGLGEASRRTPDMPLYTFRNKTTGETRQLTDPGRGMITGVWEHLGRFKGPILRALAARAPFFHDGSAATLEDAVEFYDDRFEIGLSKQERSDLVAFLRTL